MLDGLSGSMVTQLANGSLVFTPKNAVMVKQRLVRDPGTGLTITQAQENS
jgi:hypothetical protein